MCKFAANGDAPLDVIGSKPVESGYAIPASMVLPLIPLATAFGTNVPNEPLNAKPAVTPAATLRK